MYIRLRLCASRVEFPLSSGACVISSKLSASTLAQYIARIYIVVV